MNPLECSLRIIVPARQAGTHLASLHECLASLIRAREQAKPYWRTLQITVVDDYSPVPLVESFDKDIVGAVDFIRNEGSAGQGGALNFALTVSRADVYAFTDSDCVVADNWLVRLANSYQQWPMANGIAGPNWLHRPGVNRWTKWLTEQERRLVKTAFMQYVDPHGWTGRIDCRNLSLRANFVTKLDAHLRFFVDEGGPSVSGLTSHTLRQRFAIPDLAIRFEPELAVWHRSVGSLRREMRRYFSWGRSGDYASYYRDQKRGLLAAFALRHFRRHFVHPLLSGGVSPLYVSAVHGAYWLGIAVKSIKTRRRVQAPEQRNSASTFNHQVRSADIPRKR